MLLCVSPVFLYVQKMPLSGTAFSPAILDLDGQVKAADKDFNSQAIRVSRPSRPSRPPPPGIRRAPASKVKVFEPAKSLLSPTGVFDSRRSDDDLPTQDAKRSYGQRIDLEAAVDARAAAWSSFSTSVKNDISAALRLKFRDVALEARKKGNSKLQKRLEDFIESILDGFGNFLDTYGIADQNITSHRIQAVESYCKQLSAQVFRLTASHCDVEEKVTELEYEEQINELHRTVAKRTEEFHLVTQKHQKVNDELLEWTVMLEMDLDRSIQKLSEAREEGGISVQKFVAALKTEKPKALFDTCEERAGSAALSHSRPPSRSDRPGEKFLHQQHRFIQKLSTVGDDLLKVVRKSQSARNKIVAGSCEPLDAMRCHDSFSGISVRLNAPVFSNEEMPGLVLERDAEAMTGRGTVQKREAGNFNEMKKIKRQSDSTKRFQKAS